MTDTIAADTSDLRRRTLVAVEVATAPVRTSPAAAVDGPSVVHLATGVAVGCPPQPGGAASRPRRRRRKALSITLLFVILLVGSYGVSSMVREAKAAPATPGPAAPAPGASSGGAVPGATSAYYQPPPDTPAQRAAPAVVIDSGHDSPDPFMLETGGAFYLFTSQGNLPGINVPVRSGPEVGDWGPITDALPVLPAWAEPGFTWAPDVLRVPGGWVLYFTAAVRDAQPSMECVGAATATSPAGPYRAQPSPLVCQRHQGGTIDPRTFTEAGGATYLLYKSDDNAGGSSTPTSIYAERLQPDGLGFAGPPVRIFGPDEPWQGTIVEAPDMVEVDGVHWLFYSGNLFTSDGYAIGVARCAGPLGPCADVSPVPLIASNDQGEGPGEEGVFSDAAGVWIMYAPFASRVPRYTPPRPVVMARLGFGPSGPYLAQDDAPTGG